MPDEVEGRHILAAVAISGATSAITASNPSSRTRSATLSGIRFVSGPPSLRKTDIVMDAAGFDRSTGPISSTALSATMSAAPSLTGNSPALAQHVCAARRLAQPAELAQLFPVVSATAVDLDHRRTMAVTLDAGAAGQQVEDVVFAQQPNHLEPSRL